MGQQLEVAVSLINNKVQFAGSSRSNPAVRCDYFPPIGDGEGYTGLELRLMSLAVCSATAIVHLLRKMGRDVSGFKVDARGLRKDTLPMSFEKIFLDFAVTSRDAEDIDIGKVIRLSEESYCPVWALLKNNVEIVTAHRKETVG